MSIRVVDPTCVRCGKPLTDPASKALLVGPECRKGMNAVQLRDAAARAAERDDPFRIPAERAPSVQARVNNHNAREVARPDGVQLCHHENRAGACPDCRREADPWRASEVILREVRGWTFTARRAERLRVLFDRYAHAAPWIGHQRARTPRTPPTPTPL
ncbi:hypothetical protein GCM10022254_09390 [Actinomadura meridiana]|uniref:Uncharacterized protein n=1 Tax=Actinomadura meridiana TaxID=559626 RepID=A0ABP8BV00_9ACTN